MGSAGEDPIYQLLPPSPSELAGDPPSSSPAEGTGTVWTAVAHIITGVVGSGVLSLAWSMAQLGWIAGPLAILIFACVTLFSTFLLSHCYKSPCRNRSYVDAVGSILGDRSAKACNICVQLYSFGIGVAYTVTAATSMRAIQKSNCYHKEGHGSACEYSDTLYIVLFGLLQIIASQIPNFQKTQWLSVIAAIMSCSYSSIGFALGLAKIIGNGRIKGSITGVTSDSIIDKIWLVSQALGDIAFAYPFALIFFEVQGTLRSHPNEEETMRRASTIAISATTFFYFCCSVFGYAAFGNSTPGNLLTGFGFYEPYWLIDFANACVVLHLVGGYQVYSQPEFAIMERWLAKNFTSYSFFNCRRRLKLPFLLDVELDMSRLCFRTVYVALVTVIAVIFPYFNQVLAVLGAASFWVLSIYFPVKLYCKQRDIGAWSCKWVLLEVFNLLSLLLSVFAFIGSLEGLIAARFSA